MLSVVSWLLVFGIGLVSHFPVYTAALHCHILSLSFLIKRRCCRSCWKFPQSHQHLHSSKASNNDDCQRSKPIQQRVCFSICLLQLMCVLVTLMQCSPTRGMFWQEWAKEWCTVVSSILPLPGANTQTVFTTFQTRPLELDSRQKNDKIPKILARVRKIRWIYKARRQTAWTRKTTEFKNETELFSYQKCMYCNCAHSSCWEVLLWAIKVSWTVRPAALNTTTKRNTLLLL